jgi:hypothetical protein
MKSAYGLIISGVVFWASNLFADCDWVLWKSWSHLNPAVLSAISGRQPFPEELNLKEWEYLDAFQNKKECQFASEENLNTFISAQKAMLKKKIDEERANEAASKNLQLPLEKRFPAFDTYISTQRIFGRNDKDIEGLILKQIEEKTKEKTLSEVRVDEDGKVHSESGTYTFICIPITIDPRIKG